MTTYNTGNPVPSADARDRYDNSQTLDEVVNGDSESYATRTGKQVISLGGMNSRFNDAQNSRRVEYATDKLERDNEFENDQAVRATAFAQAQIERQFEFNTFLQSSGYETPVDYTPGINITRPTQVVRYLGELYRAKDSALPFVTTTFPADESKWLANGDNSLRQDLASNTSTELGAWMSGVKRNRLTNSVASVGGFLSAQWYLIQEFADQVTYKPDPDDPSTWDWAPARQYAAENCKGAVVYHPPLHDYLISEPARFLPNADEYSVFIGDTDLTTLVLMPGNPSAHAYAPTVKGDFIQNIRVRGFIVDASQQGDVDGCILFGGRQHAVEARGLNYRNIFLEDLRAKNISSVSTTGKFRQGIHMSSIFDSLADNPTIHHNIHLKRIRIEGGITGTFMGSGVPLSNEAPNFMDEIYIEDYWHDTGIPNAAYPAAGIQVGQDSYGRKIRVKNAYCANGGDVGIELNGFSDALIDDATLYRPGTGFWCYSYHSFEKPERHKMHYRGCKVIEPRNNPAWRIGQLQQGNIILEGCSLETTQDFDPRVLDFAAGTLQGLKSLAIIGFKCYVETAAKADYISLAGALALHVNADYALYIDNFQIIYTGVAPNASHEAVALILNATAHSPTVDVTIKGFKVLDQRSGTLLCSDFMRVYGNPKLEGSIEGVKIKSTVSASQARHGIYVVSSSAPAPEINISKSDFSGCTSLYEFRTNMVAQRTNMFIDPQTVKRVLQLDASTQPSNPPVTSGTYDYINGTGLPVRWNVSGGTGVAMSVSVDGGTTWLAYNGNTGTTYPNERLRITSTGAPALRLVPQTRIVR